MANPDWTDPLDWEDYPQCEYCGQYLRDDETSRCCDKCARGFRERIG